MTDGEPTLPREVRQRASRRPQGKKRWPCARPLPAPPSWPAGTYSPDLMANGTGWKSTPCRAGGRWLPSLVLTWHRHWRSSWRTYAAGGNEVPLPTEVCSQLACIWEASAVKPGNVHRYRDFVDVTYVDF